MSIGQVHLDKVMARNSQTLINELHENKKVCLHLGLLAPCLQFL